VNTNNNIIEEEKPLINYKRVWYRILHYWYFIAISLLVSLTIAFIYNRYAPKVYSVSASIIIKESEEAGQTAELLYNNPLINAYRNFLNEPYIIRSYPLLQQVVDSLSLTSVIFKEGNIKTSELYKSLPLEISGNKLGSDYLVGAFDFTILDEDSYTLSPRFELENDSLANLETIKYNGTFYKPLIINGYQVRISKTASIGRYLNVPYILSFVNGFNLAKSYSSRLMVDWAELGASVVNLRISGFVVNKEVDFLTKLIEIYTLLDLNNKRQTAKNSKDFIDQQLGYISDSLLLVEMQLERFKDENTQIDLGAEALRILYKMDALEKTKSEYIVKENYYHIHIHIRTHTPDQICKYR